MSRVIVIEFVTLDGVVEDPDGSQGTASGGWAFRYGPDAVAGDKFRLGSLLETGVLLLGHNTWQLFAKIWPGRTDEFSTAMNRATKLVASQAASDLTAWGNSAPIDGELIGAVRRLQNDRDIIVAGSTSIVHALARHGLVDEYRLLVFPIVLGGGQRLFPENSAPLSLRLSSVEQVGAAALMRYEKSAGN